MSKLLFQLHQYKDIVFLSFLSLESLDFMDFIIIIIIYFSLSKQIQDKTRKRKIYSVASTVMGGYRICHFRGRDDNSVHFLLVGWNVVWFPEK